MTDRCITLKDGQLFLCAAKAVIWGRSSVGRAPGLQPGCRRFESARLHLWGVSIAELRCNNWYCNGLRNRLTRQFRQNTALFRLQRSASQSRRARKFRQNTALFRHILCRNLGHRRITLAAYVVPTGWRKPVGRLLEQAISQIKVVP